MAVEAAVRAYFAAANKAMATGDTTDLRALTDPNCTCMDFADSVEDIYAAGGRIERATWSITSLRATFGIGAGLSDVEVSSLLPAYRELDAAGAVAVSAPDQSRHQAFTMSKASGRWLVRDVDDL